MYQNMMIPISQTNPAGYLIYLYNGIHDKRQFTSPSSLIAFLFWSTGSEHHTHAKFRQELPANPYQATQENVWILDIHALQMANSHWPTGRVV